MKYSIFFLLGFFLFGICSAHAQNNPSEEDAKKVVKLSAEAAVAYDKGDYEKALNLYTQAHSLWANPKITFAMVKCLEALKRYREALQASERGLNENPNAVLKARFESKISFLKTTLAKGTLNLLISPSGATVSIDGKVIGTAPLRPLPLDAGEHKLEISHPNHAKIVQGLSVVGGAELRMTFTLQPVTGQLSVNTTPNGAEVEIDGRPWGKTPLENLKIPIGSHVVVIKYPGYQSVNRQVNVSPDQAENISVVLVQGGSGPTEVGERPWFKSWPGWTVLALGVAAGITGALLVVSANNGFLSVKNMSASPETHSLSQKDLTNKWNQHTGEERIGYGVVGASGGLLVLSVILFATSAGVSPEKSNAANKPKTSFLRLPYPNTLGQRSRATLLYHTAP